MWSEYALQHRHEHPDHRWWPMPSDSVGYIVNISVRREILRVAQWIHVAT
jgi:hypothetical protein